MNLFKIQNSHLMEEYDFEKNDAIGIDLEEIRPFSNKRAYWKCKKCGGSWESSFAERTRCKGCPYCSGKKVLAGYNDLKTKYPEIADEWDYEKNIDILPTEVTSFSAKKVYWICDKGHSYSMEIACRTSQNQGCPFCGGKRVLLGFNDLESQFPEISKEWDYSKNMPLNPANVTYGSSKKVWWKCKVCGNEWAATVSSRTRGQGCKICGNKRGARKRIQGLVDKGGSITVKSSLLLKEWDYKKNQISPDNVSFGSGRYCWWVCERGHSYKLRVVDKTKGHGCPYCAGKKVLPGFNDLESHNPEALLDWDYETNTIKPSEITYGSKKKVYWKCQNCGRAYMLSVQEKRRRGNKYCQSCKKEFGSSIPEQAVFYYIKKAFSDAINGYKDSKLLGKKELDVFVPSINTGIEYDGQAWHDDKKRDYEKAHRLEKAGVNLIRLRESNAPPIKDASYIIDVPRNNNETDYLFLQKPIEILCDYLCNKYGVQCPLIDLSRDIIEITAGFLRLQKEQSLATCYPVVARELHPTKNRGLDPRKIGCRSGQIVWWNCQVCGNEWKARIIDRTTKGQGCKVCGNKRGAEKRIKDKLVVDGSFADNYPQLLIEWDYLKNDSLLPTKVTCGSNKKVWWKCKTCGNEWEAKISQRTRGTGCPRCYAERIIDGQISIPD